MVDEAMPEVHQQSWTPHRAQRTQETMYRLRRQIREVNGTEKVVKETFLEEQDLLGEDLESVLDGALQSKAPEDGQNLLTYAAAQGRDAWFLFIAGKIRSKMGVRALAKELRELDIDRAPLLFNAAASRGEKSCFRTAHDLVYKALGKGGLIEQLGAVDGEGRTMLMHAARSNNSDAYDEIVGIYFKAVPLTSSGYTEKDRKGMNCLHHAAEAGCSEVLRMVIKKYSDAGGSSYVERDNSNRTPVMCVLSDASREERADDSLRDKFTLLYSNMSTTCGEQDEKVCTHDGEHAKQGWMEITDVPTQRISRSEEINKARGVTELMHAARGGLVPLELALNEPLPSSRLEDGSISLDRALNVKACDEPASDEPRWEPQPAWGKGLLLAAAAERGDIDVLHIVLTAIQDGAFTKEPNADRFNLRKQKSRLAELPYGAKVKAVVREMSQGGKSLFSQAILSGRTVAVEHVYRLIVKLFGKTHPETWAILTGRDYLSGKVAEASPLACAASASMEHCDHGRDMFDLVYSYLQTHAPDEKKLRIQLVPQPPPLDLTAKTQISPLVGAAFSSNWILFWRVYDTYTTLAKKPWLRTNVWPERAPAPLEVFGYQDDIPNPILRGAWTIPAVMWRDIVEALRRATSDKSGGEELMSWREHLRAYSSRAVHVASERGAFTDLRDLVKEGFPLHDDHIPVLLESIGDHEQDIIETVLFAVANASNPFGMAAGVSRFLRRARVDHPMHQRGLRRLQTRIDRFTLELLDKLPHTVQGMGMDLLGGHQPISYGHGLHQETIHRLGNLAGFIAVQWMLEPSLLVEKINKAKKYRGPVYKDPLQSALDRGSDALEFLFSPLVLDYVHVKFAGTLPHWSSRNPFQPTINEGLYKYDNFEVYDLAELLRGSGNDQATGRNAPSGASSASTGSTDRGSFLWRLPASFMSFLLRFLQGWDHPRSNDQSVWSIPHLTILPGLQFSLAGILGKPETFFKVPVIRFVYEIFSYLVMLVLFCSSVLLKEPDFIPRDEVIFYIFAAGLLWREVLEFLDGMPTRRHRTSGGPRTEEGGRVEPGISHLGAGSNFNRMVSAFTRYVFYDTWNFMDMSTICCIFVAFIFRMIARFDSEFDLFYAQFFYALSAPLLFSRLLVLSQIDATLGPMTQVIWRMMSHMLRFSAFIAMVMLSFALAFHAVFHTCGEHSEPQCTLDDDDAFPLRDAFGTFGDALLTVLSSALGGPEFDLFDDAGSDCRCNLPRGARSAGISMMVVYTITMSVVLLNLLIAVLSTAHDEVYVNAEKEFHLARARLVVQSARSVAHRRPPPPLNLVKLGFGVLIDVFTEIWRFILWGRSLRSPCLDCSNASTGAGGAGGANGDGGADGVADHARGPGDDGGASHGVDGGGGDAVGVGGAGRAGGAGDAGGVRGCDVGGAGDAGRAGGAGGAGGASDGGAGGAGGTGFVADHARGPGDDGGASHGVDGGGGDAVGAGGAGRAGGGGGSAGGGGGADDAGETGDAGGTGGVGGVGGTGGVGSTGGAGGAGGTGCAGDVGGAGGAGGDDNSGSKNSEPFSKRPQWIAVEGFLQRLAFACTMGGASLVVFTILWIFSVPWVAWCFLRSLLPAEGGEERIHLDTIKMIKTCACWKSGKGVNIRSEEDNNSSPGYVRELLWVVCALVIMMISMAFSAVFCLLYIVGSGILWVMGTFRLLVWGWNNCSRKRDDKNPEAMPGQEDGSHWENAWKLANLRNHGIREDREHPHFYVVPFLKSKTGLDMQHLARMANIRDEKSNSEKELVEVDRELADARIDIRHLSSLLPGDGGVRDDRELWEKLTESLNNLQHRYRGMIPNEMAGRGMGVWGLPTCSRESVARTRSTGEDAPNSRAPHE